MFSNGQNFVIAIIAISTIGWIITTFIRARHGYPVEGEWGGTVHKLSDDADERTKTLADENEQLKSALRRLEERLKVLERIATDQPAALSREIDALSVAHQAQPKKDLA